MRLLVAGGGYVGLATATGFAKRGHEVQVVDIDKERAESLSRGQIPFREASLVDAFRRQVKRSRLAVHSTYESIAGPTDLAFICTSSPLNHEGLLDTTQVLAAAESVAASSARPEYLVIRSTVNPGTAEAVEELVRGLGCAPAVLVNPEFLREGSALVDFERPSRVVIGGNDPASVEDLAALYSFTGAPVIRTDRRTAELTKLASNAVLAVRVSMANEIAQFANNAGADVDVLLDGLGYDPRIGRAYLEPGIGFGGSCLPKDLAAFRYWAQRVGLPTPVFDGASFTNDHLIQLLADRLCNLVVGRPDARICIIGVGFKPGSDSLRNSQAVRLTKSLLERDHIVTIFDPVAEQNVRREFAQEIRVVYAETLDQALHESDAVIVLDKNLASGSQLPGPEVAIIDAVGRQISPPRTLQEVGNGII